MDLLSSRRLKTIWKDRHGKLWSFFCPLCSAERTLPFRPNPNQPRFLAQVLLTSMVFSLSTWSWFGWKGIVSFLPLWMGFELFHRTRSRAAVRCSHCGFDPFLTLADAKRAKAEIEAHWRRKFEEKGIPYPEKGRPAASKQSSSANPGAQ